MRSTKPFPFWRPNCPASPQLIALIAALDPNWLCVCRREKFDYSVHPRRATGEFSICLNGPAQGTQNVPEKLAATVLDLARRLDYVDQYQEFEIWNPEHVFVPEEKAIQVAYESCDYGMVERIDRRGRRVVIVNLEHTDPDGTPIRQYLSLNRVCRELDASDRTGSGNIVDFGYLDLTPAQVITDEVRERWRANGASYREYLAREAERQARGPTPYPTGDYGSADVARWLLENDILPGPDF